MPSPPRSRAASRSPRRRPRAGSSRAASTASEKAALARETAPAVADAAFAAAQGAVVGPVRSPLGWAVLSVEKIETIAARTLDQAREELGKEIAQRKTITALATCARRSRTGSATAAPSPS
ncbi:MAG: peptidyl-prolyl cis-trans isomerase [Sphingomonas sp.]